MSDVALSWEDALDRSARMELTGEAGEWLEVSHRAGRPAPGWRVEGRLDGAHYRLPGVYSTRTAAQGSALLLAMRLCPPLRAPLQAALGRLPGAWWWRLTRHDDPAGTSAICSSGIAESLEAAERSGRAAGAGWRLHVHGPGGAVRDCGFVGSTAGAR
jgi:hypothetical protein